MINRGTYAGAFAIDIYNPGNAYRANRGPIWTPTIDRIHEHAGADWGTTQVTGLGVPAAMGGVLTFIPKSSGFGMSVTVTTTMPDGSQVVILYGHVKVTAGMTSGQTVNVGQTIGTVEGRDVLTSQGGTVGANFSGPHIHLEIRVNGALQEPYQFNQWQGLPHSVGTDTAGNNLIAQTTGSAANGTLVESITTISSTGAFIGSNNTETSTLFSASGVVLGYKETIFEISANSNSAQREYTLDSNGQIVQVFVASTDPNIPTTVTRGGITIETSNAGVFARVPGVDGLIPVNADGSITVPTPPRHNTCRLDRTKNLGAAKKEKSGTIRTNIQGSGSRTVAAA